MLKDIIIALSLLAPAAGDVTSDNLPVT